MGRAPCCEKVGLKRGPWTPEEDQKLVAYINENGHGSWRALPKKAGLLRCGKSCRLRWTNYLRPDIKRGEFSLSEEQSIIQLHALLGNRWSAIASHLPKRTDNEIKNYWNTHLKKKLLKMGLDPITHKPKVDNTLMSSNANPEGNVDTDKKDSILKNKESNSNGVARVNFAMSANNSSSGSSATNHMAQWESARLEAEARLAQESQLRAKGMWSPRPAVPNPLNVAPLSTLSPCSVSKPFMSSTNVNGIASMDAYKALNAVELIHALHNWEKSLQGQAGMLWPEAWRLPNIHFPPRETQAESSSCSSPCSDANTTHTSSPSVTPGAHGMDHSSPTSTLCSFDSHNMKQRGFPSSYVPGMHSNVHMRKLSWSDAFAAPLTATKQAMPMGYCMQGVSCKVEEESSTFSSLMQDAMINVDAMESAFTCLHEEGGGQLKSTERSDVVGDDASCKEIQEAACDQLSFMVEDSNTVEEGELCVIYEDESAKDIVGQCIGPIEGKADENLSDVLLSSTMDIEEKQVNMKDGINDCKEIKNDNIRSHDALADGNEGRSMSAGGELMSAEMFKDLPKLKSEASTTSHLTSFSTLLNDDISDYWSSIMLKEPSLQQGEMTF
ncbi:hypothetical protein GOP47_0023855 [Adiantum capillus-veneris]|uniref:Uncharacterized protein n=1 Tax=Adiantum capillus-veneris TaxID=13818 RepID=A0A9D4U5B1_ADICA|nr:hypothetical protein GOP47_0023855 [Adiantum capillus-veneris]